MAATRDPAPWRRISLRLAEPAGGLSWGDALASPCATCATTPCCTHLTLHEFEVDGLTDLDYARYVLNFERLVVGITHDDRWHVYYRYPCRNLDRDTRRCTVHDTAAQPDVCKSFSPYACWYKASYDGPASDTLIQIDRNRLDWILARSRFRDDRSLEGLPSTDAMRAAFATLPAIEDPDRTVDEIERDPIYDRWRASAIRGGDDGDGDDAAGAEHSFRALADPCQGCGAPCCTTLMFPQRPPATRAQVDYFRYALGFPGVELAVSNAGWALAIRSRCRHLDGTRCGVYGTDQRPLLCAYYDAHKCGYKQPFGRIRPPSFVRVRHAEYDAVIDLLRFDERGFSTRVPGPDQVREAVEARFREAAIIER
jgi:Fe-S-cluster containining protein